MLGMNRTRYVLGCMTGTSLDGIDAALMRIEGVGTQMHARFVHGASDSLGELAPKLRALAEQTPMTSGEITKLARGFSLLHARVCQRVMEEAQAKHALEAHADLSFICVHGQTVFHDPPCSWQLFEPAPLAHAMGVPVVCNLRQANLAAGGQGAPITPLADVVLFASREGRTLETTKHDAPQTDAIINLGGFCNVTAFHTQAAKVHVLGIDVCACNHVLDAVARMSLGEPFDAGGQAALRGSVHAPMLNALLAALRAQHAKARSLGTGDELSVLLAQWVGTVPAQDLARTAVEAIATCVRDALPSHVKHVLVAGGGVRNAAMMQALRARFATCEATDAAGIPAEFREAACFAVLGALSADGVSIYGREWPPAKGEIAGQWAGEGKAIKR
jgi:1,6-anhydro-N-acetylmuramate kinase